MAASLNEIYKLLGELTGTVKSLDKKIDEISREMADSEAASATSRANVHRRLDEVIDRTAVLEGEMGSVKAKIEGVEAVTDDVKALRQQAQGAGTLGRWLIRVGIGVITVAGWIIGAYTWLTGRPPP